MSTTARSLRGAGFVAVGLAGATLLAGCSSQGIGSPDASTATNSGFAAARLSDPFQVVLIDGIETAGSEAGMSLLPTTNADEDPAKQVSDITSLLSQGINGLITIPVDSDAIVPAITQANSREIPVVTVDVAPNGGETYMIVRADNYAMGATACEEMGERLGGAGTVLELQGTLSSANGLDRSQGFTDCMSEKFPGITIISRPVDWDAAKVADATQAVASTTALDGIYMSSDTVGGSSVETVLKNLGQWKKAGEEGHIVTISIDGGPDALQRIRDGYQDALVPQPVDLYSKYAVAYLKAAVAGETQEAGPTDHDSEIIENEQGNLVDMLKAPLVTSENVDDENLWGNQS